MTIPEATAEFQQQFQSRWLSCRFRRRSRAARMHGADISLSRLKGPRGICRIAARWVAARLDYRWFVPSQGARDPRSFHDSFYGAAIFGCKLRDSAQRGANRKRPKHLASAMLRKLMKTDAKSLSW